MPLVVVLTYALVPLPDPLAAAPSLVEASIFAAIQMPAHVFTAPALAVMLDDQIGGVRLSLRANIAVCVANGVVNTVAVALLGWFRLFGLVEATIFSQLMVMAIARSVSWRRLVGAVLVVAEAVWSAELLVIGYIVAFNATDNALARLGLALAYDLVMWAFKLRMRRVFPSGIGHLGAELWQDGLGHASFVLSLPFYDDGSLAVIVLAQVWGAAMPALLHSEPVLPLYTRVVGAPARGGRERVARRFGFQMCMHVVVTAHAMVLAAVHRVGPNSAASPMGQWPADVADRAMRVMGVWVATFIIVAVAGRAIFRARWGIDALALTLDALSGMLVVAVGALVGVLTIQQLFTLHHGRVFWLLYEEDGYSS